MLEAGEEGFSEVKAWGSSHRVVDIELSRNVYEQCQVALRTQRGQREYVYHDINMYDSLISSNDIHHPRP